MEMKWLRQSRAPTPSAGLPLPWPLSVQARRGRESMFDADLEVEPPALLGQIEESQTGFQSSLVVVQSNLRWGRAKMRAALEQTLVACFVLAPLVSVAEALG